MMSDNSKSYEEKCIQIKWIEVTGWVFYITYIYILMGSFKNQELYFKLLFSKC